MANVYDPRMEETVRMLVARVNYAIAETVKQHPQVTCGECRHPACCCNLLHSGFCDSYLLALALQRRVVGKKNLAKITDVFLKRAETEKGVSAEQWFSWAVPCLLLDLQTRKCREYDSRPFGCRSYYVVTDPRHCLPTRMGGVDNDVIQYVGMVPQLALAVENDVFIFKSMGFEGVEMVAVSMTWAVATLLRALQDRPKRFWRTVLDGLTDKRYELSHEASPRVAGDTQPAPQGEKAEALAGLNPS